MKHWKIHSVNSTEIVLTDGPYREAGSAEFLVVNLRMRGWRDPLARSGDMGGMQALGQQARDQYYTITARVADGHLEVSGSEQPELRIKLPE